MSSQRRDRKDPRRDATRSALIEAAEQLFAEHGVAAVSTRQIGVAIGSLNTNVVAYHFGSKEALIEAVFHHRLPEIDRRRGELLGEFESISPQPSIEHLVRAFAWPLLEQRDSAGHHSFARFIAGLESSGQATLRALVSDTYPQTERLMKMLKERLPVALRSEANLRIRLVVSMISTALAAMDRDPGLEPSAVKRLFDMVISMAAAAFDAKVQENGSD